MANNHNDSIHFIFYGKDSKLLQSISFNYAAKWGIRRLDISSDSWHYLVVNAYPIIAIASALNGWQNLKGTT